ncbi:protein kinase family protein [Maribacter sp. ACAM166]|uniref:protein kinase family protein n=1 Tax=Maribacter sp. ACAM166 TaxID=2508996 RepID=UPI0010FE03D2|nr:protein kinase family protein [Maribacter sp. ACAM166]TLP80751.1 protein kinase family protein [Maribacter sp. ACAM166]
MSFLRYYLSLIYRTIKNLVFHIKNRSFINGFFQENGYHQTKPFNLSKWHHELYLFTAEDKKGNPVFIKLTNLPRILKNENRAYKKLRKKSYLKNHLIEHKGYIKKDGYKALILKRANGVVLNEEWAYQNIEKLGTLIKIVNEFKALSLIHRDIKLDNFIYEDGNIKVFDFSFMIDMTEDKKLKEIDLTDNENMIKLITMGVGYKPAPLKWDDYFSLHVVFSRLLKNNTTKLAFQDKASLERYTTECANKVDTNSYTILK